MKTTKTILLAAAMACAILFSTPACTGTGKESGQPNLPEENHQEDGDNPPATKSMVYFTGDISSTGLLNIYKALETKPTGKVAIKISTGESAKSNHLRPELMADLVREVNGTLVECNTAYGGSRSTTASHREAIAQRGFDKIATVDIMDEDGSMRIPVKDRSHIQYDIVGSHLGNYDFMINLAHFKGHAMGGFGGVLKNQGIGVASSSGKLYIHSAGRSTTSWMSDDQYGFLESMAAAAQAVHDYFKQDGKGIVYIDVMNNMSVDCDCDGSPAAPRLRDIGILASTDPVALDQACIDLVFNHKDESGNDAKPLQERINRQHGLHILEYAESIGLGSRNYELKNIDNGTVNKMDKLVIRANGQAVTATFEKNATAEAFAEKLKACPVTVKMSDYGDFEKVGPLGFSLPRNDRQITTAPGDVILYQGNRITIYYDVNSWSFTRMARIDGLSQDEIKAFLGSGDVTVTFSLSE